MLNMQKLKTSPNHSKALILGSKDSFLSNYNIFEKKLFKSLDATAPKPKNPQKCAPFLPQQKIFHFDITYP